MADSPRNLFLPHQNRPKGNPKTIGFWRRSFSHFFRCWKKWGRRRQKPEKNDPRSEARDTPFAAGGINRKIGGAGPPPIYLLFLPHGREKRAQQCAALLTTDTAH